MVLSMSTDGKLLQHGGGAIGIGPRRVFPVVVAVGHVDCRKALVACGHGKEKACPHPHQHQLDS
jgi:hypothetical protein